MTRIENLLVVSAQSYRSTTRKRNAPSLRMEMATTPLEKHDATAMIRNPTSHTSCVATATNGSTRCAAQERPVDFCWESGDGSCLWWSRRRVHR